MHISASLCTPVQELGVPITPEEWGSCDGDMGFVMGTPQAISLALPEANQVTCTTLEYSQNTTQIGKHGKLQSCLGIYV